MKRPVTLDLLFRQRTPGSPRWSPDGRRLVFTLGFTDVERNAAGSALWLVDREGKEPRPLTTGRMPDGSPARDTFPAWSPDGQRVAFLSDRSGAPEVWILPVFGGEAERATSPESGHGPIMTDPFFAGLEWSPDGTRLVFAAQLPLAEEDPENDARVEGLDYGETYAHVRGRIHLWTVPAGGGPARRITDGEYDHGDPRWAPDGRSLVFVSNRSLDEGPVSHSIDKNYDLWLVPADGGPERRLTDNPGPDFSPRWSPDGTRIAYLAGTRCGPHRDQYRLRVLHLETGETVDLTGAETFFPETLSAQCWSPEGDTLLFTAWTGAESHLFRASLSAGSAEALTSGRSVYSQAALSPLGQALACVHQGERTLGEVQVLSPADGSLIGDTRFNAWVEEYALGETEILSWESDGFTVEGILIHPPEAAGQGLLPALLFSHGGPHYRVSAALLLEWQWLAAQGYRVLAPNFRGSAGYGLEFLDANRRDWGGADYRDLMRGVDTLVERGLADPDRLGMLGGSYGGYMTAWAVANTDRFRAGVARAPITNLVSFYGTADLKTLTVWGLGGHPWEQPLLYAERSPVSHAARVRTPTLLLHGEADRRVPVTQSVEFYTALKARGVPVSLVRYPGEGHLISRPSHVRDYWSRTLEWLDRHVLARRPAVGNGPEEEKG